MLGFFRAAGVSAELGRGRWLWIDGVQAEHLTHLPPPETLEWGSIVSEITLKYLPHTFIKAIADNGRFGAGVRVAFVPRDKGFVVMRGDLRLAVIRAASAHIPRHGVTRANFLIPGEHWRLLADVLHNTEAELAAEPKHHEEGKAAANDVMATAKPGRAAARRFDHLPDGLAPALIEVCLAASRRIRVERQVAYDRPVVLESEVGELTLLPIKRTGSRLLAPFRLSRDSQTLTGELIVGDRDPLPLLIEEGVADEDAITAWTCALMGFADATCVELEKSQPPTRRDTTTYKPRRASPAPRPGASAQTLPRARPWPSYLQPVGHWIRYSGSFVAGHRRRLQDGQRASEAAHDRAHLVGIALQPHETWVQAHARGVPEGLEMRFSWHPPTELRSSASRSRG